MLVKHLYLHKLHIFATPVRGTFVHLTKCPICENLASEPFVFYTKSFLAIPCVDHLYSTTIYDFWNLVRGTFVLHGN